LKKGGSCSRCGARDGEDLLLSKLLRRKARQCAKAIQKCTANRYHCGTSSSTSWYSCCTASTSTTSTSSTSTGAGAVPASTSSVLVVLVPVPVLEVFQALAATSTT
jgi:hypothetical protein